ncbi:MAG: hypothetical protein OD811_03685 [Alphaproteobacteria bacterium]
METLAVESIGTLSRTYCSVGGDICKVFFVIYYSGSDIKFNGMGDILGIYLFGNLAVTVAVGAAGVVGLAGWIALGLALGGVCCGVIKE